MKYLNLKNFILFYLKQSIMILAVRFTNCCPPKTPVHTTRPRTFRTRFVLPILVRSSGAHSCVHQSPICQSLLYAKCSGTEQTSLSLPLTHPSVFYALPCLLFTLFCVMSIEINIILQKKCLYHCYYHCIFH